MSASSTNPTSLNEYLGDRRMSLVEPVRNGKSLFTQEFGVEQPALVAGAIIGKHRDDGMAGPHLLGESDSARHIDPARPAKAKPFLAQEVEDDGQRLGIRDLIGLVDLRPFQVGGDATLADAFGD